MSLQDDVVALLRSREAQRINFIFDSIRVYGAGYDTLAGAITNGHIIVYGMASRVKGGLVCEYLEREGANHVNRLLVDTALDFGAPIEAQLVVHEMTHALMDYHGAPLNLLDSEAVAYIAGAFYCFLKGVSSSDIINSFNSLSASHRDYEMTMVYDLAYGIAQSLATTRGGYAVAAANVASLRQAIARTQLYGRRATGTVAYDGI